MKEKATQNRNRRQTEVCIKMGVVKKLYGEGVLRHSQLEKLMARYEKQRKSWENDA